MAVKAIPDGFNSVSAYLIVSDVDEALNAYRAAVALGSLGPDSQRYVSARIAALEAASD